MKIVFTSSFSPGMISPVLLKKKVCVTFENLSLSEAKTLARFGVSAVGHESTAKVMSMLLGTELKTDRTPLRLSNGQKIVVFSIQQSKVKRLEEGDEFSEQEILDAWNSDAVYFLLATINIRRD